MRGKLVEDLAAIRFQPRVHAQPEGRIGRKRQDVRQKIARVVHQLDRGLAVFHADVHVQAEDQVGPRHQLQVFDDVLVAVVSVDLLHPPVGKRMGRGRSQPQAVLLGQRDHVAAQLLDFFLGVLDVAADRGSDLDHGLVHLRLDPLLQEQLALLDDLRVDVRAQIARDRIDGLIFLFDPDGESRKHGYGSLPAESLAASTSIAIPC